MELVARVETVCVLLGCFFFVMLRLGVGRLYSGTSEDRCLFVWLSSDPVFFCELEMPFHWDIVSCICMFLW